MSGLFLGLLGGIATSAAIIIGALFVFFIELFSFNYQKNIFFSKKLDFLIGIILFITSFSLLAPQKLELLHEKNIKLVFLIFILGICLFLLLQKGLKTILEMVVTNNLSDKKRILFILFLFFKNSPIGMAAGIAMNLTHSGEGNSLLVLLFIYNFFNGIVLAIYFLSIGKDPLLSSLGILCCALLSSISGLCIGYWGNESILLLAIVLAFSGGAIIAPIKLFIPKTPTLFYNPKWISLLTVVSIFIIWKEIL